MKEYIVPVIACLTIAFQTMMIIDLSHNLQEARKNARGWHDAYYRVLKEVQMYKRLDDDRQICISMLPKEQRESFTGQR